MIACPVCGRRVKPLRKTMDGRRAQLRSHAADAPVDEGAKVDRDAQRGGAAKPIRPARW